MSLLNKMLLDLEARQRRDGGVVPDETLTETHPAAMSSHRGLAAAVLLVATLLIAALLYLGLRPDSESRSVAHAPVVAPATPAAHMAAPPVPPEAALAKAPVLKALPSSPAPATPERSSLVPEPAAHRAPLVSRPVMVVSRRGVRKVLLPLTPHEQARHDYLTAAMALERGQTRVAIRALRSSLALNPADTQVRELLAGLELQRGDTANAKVLLKQGIAISPGYVRFAELLANTYLREGHAPQALALLVAHRAQAMGNARYLSFLAALEERAGFPARAARDYRAALALAPGDAASWAGLGIALQVSHPGAARRAYRRALSNPGLSLPLAHYIRKQLMVLSAP